ncbi:MAG TPA: hypothetical protein ENJ77_01165 [Candidatus Moranbacteria bacterium]|nr:hypothetical protein [Candidatus Moranbacteria bacterium]
MKKKTTILALAASFLLILPFLAAAQQFENPLRFDTVEGFLSSVLVAVRNIIGTVALVAVVIGAVMYVLSAGNEERITAAKKTITAAMIGLAIVIVAPSFLFEIYNALTLPGADMPDEVRRAIPLTTIALNVLQFLLGVIGTLATIMLVVGGAMYIGAAGDERQVDSAKSIVKYSIVGIAVALLSLIIVRTLAQVFVG